MKKWISGEEECRLDNVGITDTWSCANNRTRMFWLEITESPEVGWAVGTVRLGCSPLRRDPLGSALLHVLAPPTGLQHCGSCNDIVISKTQQVRESKTLLPFFCNCGKLPEALCGL